jgi:tetratricopeptide (TPR) repeat protein
MIFSVRAFGFLGFLNFFVILAVFAHLTFPQSAFSADKATSSPGRTVPIPVSKWDKAEKARVEKILILAMANQNPQESLRLLNSVAVQCRGIGVYYACRAEIYFRTKQYRSAMHDAKLALELEPRNLDALIVMARGYELSGDLPHSLEFYNKILQVDKKHAVYYLCRASVLERLGRKEEALKDRKVALSFKDTARGRVDLVNALDIVQAPIARALSLREQGKPKECISKLLAIKGEPVLERDALVEVVRTFELNFKEPTAHLNYLSKLEKLCAKYCTSAGDVEWWEARARALYKRGELYKSLDEYGKAFLDYDACMKLVALDSAYDRSQKQSSPRLPNGAALGLAANDNDDERAVIKEQKHLWLRQCAALSLLARQNCYCASGNPELARRDLMAMLSPEGYSLSPTCKILAVDPSAVIKTAGLTGVQAARVRSEMYYVDQIAFNKPWLYLELGDTYVAQNRWLEAKEFYLKSKEIGLHSSMGKLAKVYEKLNDYPAAYQALSAWNTIDGLQVKHEYLSRGLLSFNFRKYDKALEDFEAHLRNFKNDSVAMKGKADALMALGRAKEALLVYNEMLLHDAHNRELYEYRAQVYKVLGEERKSSADLKRAKSAK